MDSRAVNESPPCGWCAFAGVQMGSAQAPLCDLVVTGLLVYSAHEGVALATLAGWQSAVHMQHPISYADNAYIEIAVEATGNGLHLLLKIIVVQGKPRSGPPPH